jgi:hypothetical protein
VGDKIKFGGYDWIVLDVQGGKALILTEKVLFHLSYDASYAEVVTWADCSVRTYLNEYFYDSFSAADKVRIAETRNVNKDNPWHGTDGGADTTDKVFLLSIEEVVKYFGDSGQLRDPPYYYNEWMDEWELEWAIDDQYNDKRVAYSAVAGLRGEPAGSATAWWLRSPGNREETIAYVSFYGSVDIYGMDYYYPAADMSDGGFYYLGVRPALWLNP